MFRAPHETFYKACCGGGTGYVSSQVDGSGCDTA